MELIQVRIRHPATMIGSIEPDYEPFAKVVNTAPSVNRPRVL